MNTPERSGTAALVLVVDDEPQIRRFLDISLRAQGYRTALAATAQEGLAAAAAGRPDLVVLDLGLPDRDGLEMLRDLRQWSGVPVVALTVRSDEGQKVAVLDAGANDYVTKPFGVPELMARIRVLLRARAAGAQAAAPFDDGRLRVDLAGREVTLAGERLTLTRKEYALLAVLLQHAGRVVTQPQLLRELWGPSHEEDAHYLRVLVGKLRHKLNDDAAAPRYIATEPGVGLRFIGHGRGADEDGGAAAQTAAGPSAAP